MKPFLLKLLLSAICVLAAAAAAASLAGNAFAVPVPAADPGVWVMPYYLSGNQKREPPSDIDFRSFNVLIHFGIIPNADGTIDPMKCGTTPAQSEAVVSRAHAAGDKVTICLFTDNGGKKIRSAMSDAHRATLVRSLMQFIVQRHYDGLDIDLEPINNPDVPMFSAFIRDMRTAMNATGRHYILTAAVVNQQKMFARLQDDMDRIDLMTYDLSGPYPGNKTWYNASVYDGNMGNMSDGSPQSADAMVRQFLAAGVKPGKLCIGIAFYGYVWTGVDRPGVSVKGTKVDDGADYQMIMNDYYTPSRYHWDPYAQAPWLSMPSDSKAHEHFISYDDRRLAIDKVYYARTHHLGGVIIWEMTGGYDFARPAGRRDMLLKNVGWAWRSPLWRLTAWRR